ncbi:MAG: ABC transporter ATP-binding protein [Paracoccaceae bacterium]|nr:ABC transporter ATP-binding protein [Paracoccaceae bacterium]
MNISPLIKASELSLSFPSGSGKIEILKSVNFSLHDREKVALVGPSGSGKSSLLMLLGGLEQCTTGSIVIDNNEITKFSEDELADFRKENMGIVFQSFHLIPTMTAIENVCIPLELAGFKDVRKRAGLLLGEVGLIDRFDHFPAQLSGGEQQRVAIARALAIEPQIILADEPTGNLDQNTGDKIIELLFRLTEKNKSSLIIVTHSITLARKCDRIVELIDGKTVEK